MFQHQGDEKLAAEVEAAEKQTAGTGCGQPLPRLQQAALRQETVAHLAGLVELVEVAHALLGLGQEVAVLVQTVMIELVVNVIQRNFRLFQVQTEEGVLVAVVCQGFIETAFLENGFRD